MPGTVNPPRAYRSEVRAAAAARTRAQVLEAARAEMLELGYARATVTRIAERAGVAVDTVYTSVGRKPELLRLLVETAISGTDAPLAPEQRAYVQEISAEPTAEAKLRRYARAVREIGERLWPVQRVLVDAAGSHAELRALRDEISARRAANLRRFAAEVLDAPGARPGDVDQVADVVWVMSAPETAALLLGERGWDPGRYERWLADAWVAMLALPGGGTP